MINKMLRLLDTNSAWRWGAFWCALGLLHFKELTQPPLWDSVMCIVPAARELASQNFDLLKVLRLPDYLQDGPNCHMVSLVTWILAGLMGHFEVGTYIPLMHLLTMAFVAWGMSAFYSFSRRFLPMSTVGALCLLVTVFPAFFVQTGEIYLEAPLFAGVALTLNALASGKVRRSLVWSAVTIFIKQNGVMAGLVVSAAGLFNKTESPKKRLLVFSFRILIVGALALIVVWLHGLGSVSRHTALFDLFDLDRLTLLAFNLYFDGYQRYLANTPDLLVVFVASLVSSFALVFRAFFDRKQDDSPPTPVVYAAVLILAFFLFMFVLMPVLWSFAQILIRYYMVIFPFCLVVLAYAIGRKTSQEKLQGLLALAIVLCVINHNGRLYPSFVSTYGNDFSIAERSMEYRGLLEVQQQNIAKIREFSSRHQVLIGFFEQRYLRYPGNGYVTELTPNAIRTTKYVEERGGDKFNISGITDCIYLNMLYPWQETMMNQAIVDSANETPGFEVKEVWQHQSGVFRAQIFSVSPPGKSCQA